MSTENLTYKPSIVARLARVVIPLMQRILPRSAYKLIYDMLYNSYKWLLRKSYVFHLFAANFFGSKESKLRAKLTWKLLPYTMGGRKALENAFDLVAKIERENVLGVLVECGVAEGGTAGMLALANRELGKNNRTKWFFDSYEGLPEPTVEDYINGKAGGFIRPLPKGSCLGTIEQVSELMFNTLKMEKEEVHLVKGWFQDTVPVEKENIDDFIAILRLDGDWYESTKIPLDNFYDKISVGGFVIIDDYGTCYGAKKATNEFRQERGITSPLMPDGRGGVWFRKEVV
jgi:O-methyltransferase